MTTKLKTKTVTYGHQTLIFDRSDPNEIVATRPARNGLPTKHWTRLEDIKEHGWVGRSDLAMVNIWEENSVTNQICVYGNKDGTIEWNGAIKYFDKKERQEIQDIVNRLIEIAKTIPEMAGYLQ